MFRKLANILVVTNIDAKFVLLSGMLRKLNDFAVKAFYNFLIPMIK